MFAAGPTLRPARRGATRHLGEFARERGRRLDHRRLDRRPLADALQRRRPSPRRCGRRSALPACRSAIDAQTNGWSQPSGPVRTACVEGASTPRYRSANIAAFVRVVTDGSAQPRGIRPSAHTVEREEELGDAVGREAHDHAGARLAC